MTSRHNGERGATGVWWVEARDVTRHPTMHRTVTHNKNYLAKNAKHGKVEKPWVTVRIQQGKVLTRVILRLQCTSPGGLSKIYTAGPLPEFLSQ